MSDATILTTRAVGAIMASICCATLVLVVALGAVGLSAWAGGLDNVLFDALAIFLGIIGFGLWRQQRSVACCETNIHTNNRECLT